MNIHVLVHTSTLAGTHHGTHTGGDGTMDAVVRTVTEARKHSVCYLYHHSLFILVTYHACRHVRQEEMLAEALSQISELRSVDLGFTTRSDEKSHGSRTTAMTEGPDPGAADAEALVSTGAGDGNRTRVLSLGS